MPTVLESIRVGFKLWFLFCNLLASWLGKTTSPCLNFCVCRKVTGMPDCWVGGLMRQPCKQLSKWLLWFWRPRAVQGSRMLVCFLSSVNPTLGWWGSGSRKVAHISYPANIFLQREGDVSWSLQASVLLLRESYKVMLANRMACLGPCVLYTQAPVESQLNSVVICECRDPVMFSAHPEQQTLVVWALVFLIELSFSKVELRLHA